MIQEGQQAPDFKLAGSDGREHAPSDHAGQPVVLYFYPKDDTPGCTTEACDFRDNFARVTAAGAIVYGVSRDALDSHDRFIEKYSLNFTLLSDPDLVAHKAYDAWGEKKSYGRVTEGVIRSTFLIAADGTVAQKWRNVRVKGHVDKVLAALEALTTA